MVQSRWDIADTTRAGAIRRQCLTHPKMLPPLFSTCLWSVATLWECTLIPNSYTAPSTGTIGCSGIRSEVHEQDMWLVAYLCSLFFPQALDSYSPHAVSPPVTCRRIRPASSTLAHYLADLPKWIPISSILTSHVPTGQVSPFWHSQHGEPSHSMLWDSTLCMVRSLLASVSLWLLFPEYQ